MLRPYRPFRLDMNRITFEKRISGKENGNERQIKIVKAIGQA